MNEFPRLFDYISFVNFSNDLDELAIDSNKFLCEKLLALIEKNFGISNSLISMYDGEKLTGGITHKKTNLLREPYLRYYYKKDPISSYISNRLTHLSSAHMKPLKATDIIPISKFDESEYCSYLSIANLYYLAVAPVPYQSFRLCIYKNKEMADFSEAELNALSSIASLISKKYSIFCKTKEKQIINQIKSSSLDNSSIGIVIINSGFEILEYNESALPFINAITQKTDVFTFFSEYLENGLDSDSSKVSFDNSKFNLPSPMSMCVSSYTDVEFPNFLQKYYIITLKCKTHALSANKTFIESYKLSRREFEIIELLTRGLKYQEIADHLFISMNTLRTHIKNIYAKLNIDNQRTLLTLYNQYNTS